MDIFRKNVIGIMEYPNTMELIGNTLTLIAKVVGDIPTNPTIIFG